MPGRATVYRVIASLDKFEVTSVRYSPRIARMKFRSSGQGPRPTRILERVEIDHTPLDLFVLDRETNLPLGRPTVTLAIDVYSKMPVGMHVGFQGTSIEAVFACLRHALEPKTYIKEKYSEISNSWPCYGIIENLICDNGLEFHSAELERVAFEIGTQLVFCPKRQPYYKGSIERYLKTLNFQFARTLPGSSFARWFHREDYDPLKHAVVEFDQLMRYLHHWIVDIYAQTEHRGINSAPYKKWTDGVLEHAPAMLPCLDRLDIALGRTCQRTLEHYGIDVNNIRYNDPALTSIRQLHGTRIKVDVRLYFGDLSYVHVINPMTKETILVPALDQEYTRDLTLEQHGLLCRHIREVSKRNVNMVALAKAKADLRTLVSEMANSKSQRTRQKTAKIRGIGRDKNDILIDTIEPAATLPMVRPLLSSQLQTDDLPEIGFTNLVQDISDTVPKGSDV